MYRPAIALIAVCISNLATTSGQAAMRTSSERLAKDPGAFQLCYFSLNHDKEFQVMKRFTEELNLKRAEKEKIVPDEIIRERTGEKQKSH